MSEAIFDLRKWVTKDKKLQKIFDSQENSETKMLNKTNINLSEEQFELTKNNYKKLEWDWSGI